jgi:uncharacterized protein YggE
MSKVVMVMGAVALALLVVLLAVQLLVVWPVSARAGSAAQPTGISVMAQGEASGEPDLAMITIGVQTRDAEARTAAAKNSEQMVEVMAALESMGLPEEDIQTVDYSIQPEIDWNDGEQRLLGYVVTNSVLVKMREMDKVGDLLDAVTEAGANSIYGIQFAFDDPTALKEEARADAMSQAQAKAQALAQLAGARLGQARYISESFMEAPPYYLEPIYAVGGMGADQAASVMPGQLKVTVQVQVTYEIG